MSEPDYRARFDATVTFGNGGGLTVHDFRVDVPHAEVSVAEVGELFVASLSLLMVDRVEVTGLRVFPEQHKGTRGGPSDRTGPPGPRRAWVELSHPIEAGMRTYPGLPAPEITPHLTREASREVYGGAAEFAIDRISMVGNTGTYLDSPYHRYPDGADLAGLPLSALADLDTAVVRAGHSGSPGQGLRAQLLERGAPAVRRDCQPAGSQPARPAGTETGSLTHLALRASYRPAENVHVARRLPRSRRRKVVGPWR